VEGNPGTSPLVSKGWPSQRDGGIDPEEMKGQHTYRGNSGLIRIGIPLSPRNLNGSHRLKSRSYQIRNLKNLLTGPPADLYLLHLGRCRDGIPIAAIWVIRIVSPYLLHAAVG
jgi:hypothetical protein